MHGSTDLPFTRQKADLPDESAHHWAPGPLVHGSVIRSSPNRSTHVRCSLSQLQIMCGPHTVSYTVQNRRWPSLRPTTTLLLGNGACNWHAGSCPGLTVHHVDLSTQPEPLPSYSTMTPRSNTFVSQPQVRYLLTVSNKTPAGSSVPPGMQRTVPEFKCQQVTITTQSLLMSCQA